MAEITHPPSAIVHKSCGIAKSVGTHFFTWCFSGTSNFKGILRSATPFQDYCTAHNLYAFLHLDENKIEIWLKCARTIAVPFHVHFLISIVCHGSENFQSSDSALFFQTQSSCLCASVKNPWKQKNVPKGEAGGDNFPFPDTTLITQCYVSIYSSNDVLHFDNLLKLSNDFKQLLNSETSTDIILRVENEDLCVHSWVLREGSSHFATLLNAERSVEVIDMCCKEVSVVKALVSYMYTGTIGNFETSLISVEALYLLADNCEVEGVKVICADMLQSMLTVNNVCSVLQTADECNDNLLKMKCFKLIFRNFSYIANMPDWDSLVTSDPELASNVLKYVSKRLLLHEGTPFEIY